jgi:hypothetical protein
MVEESLYRLLAKPAPAFVDWILRHEETFIDLNCTYVNDHHSISSSLVISGSAELEVKFIHYIYQRHPYCTVPNVGQTKQHQN